MWKSLPEYSDPNSSYENWKRKLVSLYPGANEEKRWTITDVNKLIRECSRMAEQSRLLIKGLSTDLWHKIFTRLSIKEPDHDPDDFGH